MTRETCKKEPPVEAITGGYRITQARLILRRDSPHENTPAQKALYYLARGIEDVERAIDIVERESDMFRMEPGEGMMLLYEAQHVLEQYNTGSREVPYSILMATLWKIAAGHNRLRLLMQDLGYRTITNRDFAEHGDGGGR